MNARKICVVSGSRADFGLLTPLLYEIDNDPDLWLQLVITGMHLSTEFGLTYKNVLKHFRIDKKVEILLASDTGVGISKSMGLAQISLAEVYEELQPDIVLVLGDRTEILAAVISAMVMNIPIAHLSGGELTAGAIDDAIRHAITKMSHLHFVATDEYRKRVIQLGENPEYVFNFGEAGLDNIKNLDLLSRCEFVKSIGLELNTHNLLVTYHPTTLEGLDKIKHDVESLLSVLSSLEDTHCIFTKANSDAGGRMVNEMIDAYVQQNKGRAVVFSSLGQLRYLSALQFVDAVVGNTSSGLVEAPSFKIGTINIGERQRGRVVAKSVICCGANREDIVQAFERLYSGEFRRSLAFVTNPYEQGESSLRTKEVLKSVDLTSLLKKEFRDNE